MPSTNPLDNSDRSLRSKLAYVERTFREGNYCGHIPDKPRWHYYQTPSKGKLLPIQKALQKKVKGFYSNPYLLPRLCCVLDSGKTRSINKNGHFRQISSERRESLVLVLLWVVGRLNFATGEIGVRCYHNGKTRGIALDTIADELNLNYSAVQRAFAQLKESGYMDYDERYETFEMEEKGVIKKYDRRVISIRSIKLKFFDDVGISMEWLLRAQKYARELWLKKRNVYFANHSKKRGGKKALSFSLSVPELNTQLDNTALGKEVFRQLRLMLEAPPPS